MEGFVVLVLVSLLGVYVVGRTAAVARVVRADSKRAG